VQSDLIWDHHAIINGEYWRIITGHLLHTNTAHLIMNLMGLWCIAYIFKPSNQRLIITLLFASITIGMTLLMTDTSLYVGLSGILHCLFTFFALYEVWHKKRSSLWLVLAVSIKIASEWLTTNSVSSGLIEATVSRESHLLGYLSAYLLLFIYWFVQTRMKA
jgi:rhomboid family GlyGly-CTERM serine protease